MADDYPELFPMSHDAYASLLRDNRPQVRQYVSNAFSIPVIADPSWRPLAVAEEHRRKADALRAEMYSLFEDCGPSPPMERWDASVLAARTAIVAENRERCASVTAVKPQATEKRGSRVVPAEYVTLSPADIVAMQVALLDARYEMHLAEARAADARAAVDATSLVRGFRLAREHAYVVERGTARSEARIDWSESEARLDAEIKSLAAVPR